MIKKLATKDNFWNLMFWVGIVAGSSLANAFDPSVGGFIFWATIIGVPWFIKRKQNLSINSDNVFVNSQGQLLNERYPVLVILMIVASVPSLVLCGLIMDAFHIKAHDVLFGLFIGLLFLPLTLYFIKINCPISIMFYASGWREEITGWKIDPNASRIKHNFSDTNIHRPSALSAFMRENTITDPRWAGSSSNVHNINRR